MTQSKLGHLRALYFLVNGVKMGFKSRFVPFEKNHPIIPNLGIIG